ncbi:MAG: Rieske (2Fe-2S) protein [SAR86 cluster bacterium]|uniref:Rieske (2Fe-2S) protein n=1 Tax=SAR86 cluster bacterium TaxID=2030880 RepID=A0A2A5CD73_9GAMM|nr:aromatic ring-hydroxylating dioxygenase subunit alpha [bacterium AH-315-I11]PCJ41461.1 MAG: Rieske (2Fe-2S) protein [SAR86 cluster bacterium]
MYIVNSWYVAATSEELKDKPLGRTICEQEIVFFRNSSGVVAAVEDFCPHRGLPLSLGKVEGDVLVCGYHGLCMGQSGETVSMPKQQVHNFPCNRTYPVIEKAGFIWVWPGDFEKANIDQLPELHWADNPDWAYGGGVYHVAADYRLMIDNLMDLSHENYVHSSSIGQKEIDEQPVHTKLEGDQVITSRFMESVEAPPFWKMAMRQKGLDDNAIVDRWQICRFQAPSQVMVDVGVALAGNGGFDADLSVKAYAVIVDFITPETPDSHWYFWGLARTWGVADSVMTSIIKEGQGEIFQEDMDILERQQLSLSANPKRRLLSLDIDAGGAMSRRLIQKHIKKEQTE